MTATARHDHVPASVLSVHGIGRNQEGLCPGCVEPAYYDAHTDNRCPACDEPAYYLRVSDRYYHADGAGNGDCWLAILRGMTLAESEAHNPGSDYEAAIPWLENYIRNHGGAASAQDVRSAGEVCGHGRTALHCARVVLGLKAEVRGGTQEATWSLPHK